MSEPAYCQTCKRRLNSRGVASHRAAHIRRGESCTIVFYITGRRVTYKPEADNGQDA